MQDGEVIEAAGPLRVTVLPQFLTDFQSLLVHWFGRVEVVLVDQIELKLEGRADDTEEVIRRRMEIYAEQTEPLTAVYREKGLLVQVDGMGSVEEVSGRLLGALK